MNAVIYARYSSDRQREESIEGQLRECTEYAKKNNLTLLGTYVDRALSARTADRPDFQRMIADSAKGIFDVVLVWKLDRFSRDRYDSAHYKHILKKNGVRLISIKENISDDPESREFYCEVIMDESSKMNQMVKKLLTLNQLEFGNDVVTMERFVLVSLVKGVIQSASILAQQKEAKILFEEEEPVYVWADEFKVEEVVTNYISNALNHLEGDKVIDVKLIRKPGNVIRTTVFNTGKPIPAEDLDKIWIKFYKVDKARTREYGGSGIGLSIVKAIMDSFHQKCGVKNYDNGVEFWFELDGGEKCGNTGKDDQRLLPGPEQI